MPTQLKVLAGNPGKRPFNEQEPIPAAFAPEPPPLSDSERAEWDYITGQLSTMGTLAVSDCYVIEQLAKAVVEERELGAFLSKNGRTYEALVVHPEDSAGTPEFLKTTWKARPEVAMRKSARQDIYRFSTLLGFDPSSRSRLKVNPVSATEGMDDLLDKAPSA